METYKLERCLLPAWFGLPVPDESRLQVEDELIEINFNLAKEKYIPIVISVALRIPSVSRISSLLRFKFNVLACVCVYM